MNIAAFGIGGRPDLAVTSAPYRIWREETIAQSGDHCGTVNASDRIPSLELRVCRSLDDCEADWSQIEAEAGGTLYQSMLWCRAWQDTVGLQLGTSPVIIVGRTDDGTTMMILPLQIRRRYGVRVLEWLGTPHINYGHGLFHPSFEPFARAWLDLHFSQVILSAGKWDAVALREIPFDLGRGPSPLAGHFNLACANHSYVLQLDRDFDALHARKRDGEDRRAARKKLKALQSLGTVELGTPQSREELHHALSVMFEHQEGRLAERGVYGVFGAAERAFIHRFADLQPEDDPVLKPFTIKLNGEILAVLLGGVHAKTYWALISSLAPGALRKHSPGDLALRFAIQSCCADGLDRLDFSSGESRYKKSWADSLIYLRAIIRARTLRGLVFALALYGHETGKRTIKQSPRLLAAATTLRLLLRGRPA